MISLGEFLIAADNETGLLYVEHAVCGQRCPGRVATVENALDAATGHTCAGESRA